MKLIEQIKQQEKRVTQYGDMIKRNRLKDGFFVEKYVDARIRLEILKDKFKHENAPEQAEAQIIGDLSVALSSIRLNAKRPLTRNHFFPSTMSVVSYQDTDASVLSASDSTTAFSSEEVEDADSLEEQGNTDDEKNTTDTEDDSDDSLSLNM